MNKEMYQAPYFLMHLGNFHNFKLQNLFQPDFMNVLKSESGYIPPAHSTYDNGRHVMSQSFALSQSLPGTSTQFKHTLNFLQQFAPLPNKDKKHSEREHT